MGVLDNPSIAGDVEASNASLNSGSFHLNNNSSRTQLDMEQDNHDDDELPPLDAYLSGWTFWFKFALWPSVFLVLNAIIVSTLIAFDEYQFQYGGRHHRFYGYDFDIYGNPEKIQNNRLEMMKYNRIVMTILLLVDALIIYRSAIFLEKSVRELDMIGEMDDDDAMQHSRTDAVPTASGSIKPNVHAQVSRKMDTVLGRTSQPRASILVSILWLLFVASATIGIVSFSDWMFTMSPKAKKVCLGSSSSKGGPDDDTAPYDDAFEPNKSTNHNKSIDKIPSEIQDWAQRRHDWYSTGAGLVHLSNGATYFSAIDPRQNKSKYEEEMYSFSGQHDQLVSTGADGQIRFYSNVKDPRGFVSVTGESELNSTGFCCMYMLPKKEDSFIDMYSPSTPAALCVTSSDDTSSGIFPNVTLYDPKPPNTRNSMFTNFEGASLTSFNNMLWVQLTFSTYSERTGNMKTSMEFYTITPSTTLILNLVTKTDFNGYSFEDSMEDPFLMGPGSPCYKWTKYIDLTVLVLVLVPASAWLLVVKNLSAGVVPACAAASFLLARTNNDLGIALCSVAAAAAFLGLLGCVPIPLGREKLVWGLYTMLAAIASMIFAGRFYMYYDGLYNFERALFTISIATIIGFILNHPVLYIFGWVGGMWAVFCGFFLLFTPQHHQGLFAICLGIIMGSGCVTVGFNLIKYRAHLLYYTKRAWSAMNNAMQQTGSMGRNNNHRNHTAAPRYTPVAPAPPVPPTRSPAPGHGENDITTGLLNQNSEESTRNV
jgi:hypothetical protein